VFEDGVIGYIKSDAIAIKIFLGEGMLVEGNVDA